MHDFQALTNRIAKNAKHRRSWAKRTGTEAYRVYEMDIPELRYIIDVYGEHAVVYDKGYDGKNEVEAKNEVEDKDQDQVLRGAVSAGLNIPIEKIHLKKRRRMAGLAQYEKLGDEAVKLVVKEESSRYLINLTDYLDTGLFLDHRPLRSQFRKLPKGTRFLNLFCYTGSVTIAAAQAGAKTVSVDMSNTYLAWAEENLRLNDLPIHSHELVREDALKFLEQGPRGAERFDVIFLDPPTFSNSKKMQGSFDVQRDHRLLISRAMAFLAPGGTLFFSTNRQRFKLDPGLEKSCRIEDISERTIPEDFRDKKIHRVFTLRAVER